MDKTCDVGIQQHIKINETKTLDLDLLLFQNSYHEWQMTNNEWWNDWHWHGTRIIEISD